MDISWLTMRDLQYIVSVAELSHFGQAAKQCGVSQPALSTQIKKCENLLNVILFERTKRKVILTEVGERLVTQAKVLLGEADKMAELAQIKTTPLSGRLRLGGIATVSPYLTPYYLAPLKRAYPHLELKLQEGFTDALLKDLKKGDLDIVIASPTFDEEGLELYPLYFEPFMLAYPFGHPLENMTEIRSTQLKEKDMILLSDGHCLRDQVLEACSKIQGKINTELQATSLITLLHVIAAGSGYTIVPLTAAVEDQRLKGLVKFKHFSDKKVGRIVTLVTRQGYTKKKDVLALKEIIQRNLPPGTTKA